MDNRKFRESAAQRGAEPAAAAGVLTVDQARAVLSRSIALLDEVVVLARGVIASTPPAVAIAVFVEDKPIPVEGLSSPQKRPRGRAHPLLALVKLGVQGARLVKQLVWSLHPELRNQPPADPAADPLAAVNSFENVVAELAKRAREMGLDPGLA